MLLTLSVQCSDENEVENPIVNPDEQEVVADHTLLVYIAGENSLSMYADPNIKAMQQGLLNADSTLHLIIFEDNQKLSQSLLFRLERNGEKIDTVMIAEYADLNSADPDVMREVVRTAFATNPARHNGVVLWSHAMSWIPSANFAAQSRATDSMRGKVAYFGQDNSSYMELWDLRSALEAAPHLDYILVDACFFSTVEVAYELRGVTDYIMAAPTEVFGTGYPYQNMLPILTEINDDNVEAKLVEAAGIFQQTYGSNGTLSVIRTSGMETLAQQWVASHAQYPEVWAEIQESPKTWFNSLQHYGRNRVGALYYYYDFADLLNQVAAKGGAEAAQTDVSDAVAFSFYSPIFTDNSEALYINTCCGLGVSVPEMFSLCSNASRLKAAYPYTQWGQLTTDTSN